ncbi:MAG: protein-(glutamine-N5) methyltransferase, release factor-specific [Gemmatimonadetes bacterium]|nr:protein-(glutamine-N5) methyltransferase, release factor-specific [Gemmatimonadota bacterium]
MSAGREKVWTVIGVLCSATEYFERRGVENPRGNAELLLAHVLECKRIDLYLEHDRPLAPEERGPFKALIKRRTGGEPLQYIVGHTEFLGIEIRVGPGVLIPRPETETLASEIVQVVEERPRQRIVDAGCGSGALAIFFGKRWPRAEVLATDRSPRALDCTAENARRQSLERVRCLAADLGGLPVPDRSVDLVVSNPPYVASAEIATLPRDIRGFEPREALDGGDDGLDLIRALIPEAARALKPGGWLGIEVGAGQARSTAGLCEAAFDGPRVHRDLAGIERVILARRKGI